MDTKIGTIVILNGTSSSGKTSVLRVLQNRLQEPFLEAGIDKFIWMLPERYLERPLWDDVLGRASEAGAAGHQLVYSMHRAIRALALSGSNVLVDHVLVEQAWVTDAASMFHDLPAYLAAIRCPLEVLEERERARRNRTLGQARMQYDLVHAHQLYDVEVDTSMNSPEECAGLILKRVSAGAPQAFSELFTRFF